MDPRLLDYYERELQYIREMGREFARTYPKIGARLDLDSFECADPYVERLLEGFAFLTARIQLKLDAEFPRFTQHLLELIYPNYLAPVPSMAVVQFTPDLDGGVPPEGHRLPKGTRLFATAVDPQSSRVELRTGMDLDLRPLRLTEAEYLPPGSFDIRAGSTFESRAALRLTFQTAMELPLSALAGLDRLVLFLTGSGRIPWQLHEWIHAHTSAVLIATANHQRLYPAAETILPLGLEAEEALLPVDARNFQGYRLLQEYFAFPERFRFFGLRGLESILADEEDLSFTVTFLFDRENTDLENSVTADSFALHCTPAVNLFPRRCDRIHVDPGKSEYHVVVDRTRPLSYEVYAIRKVEGYGEGNRSICEFQPFYRLSHHSRRDIGYYTLQRRPHTGVRDSDYTAHEVFLALVVPDQPPFPGELKQLGLEVLCTNRDLCRRLNLGGRMTDFHLDIGAPVTEIRAIAGPSAPRATYPEGEYAWRLISHLSLNYQSLTSTETLREMLALYAPIADPAVRRQIEGLVSVTNRPVVRRLPGKGPITFGRGTEVRLEFDEKAFEGYTPFLLGQLLHRFLAAYTNINSFVETTVTSKGRGSSLRFTAGEGHEPLV